MTILYSVVTGDDIFTTGAGSDLVLGYAGDDAITIDGAGDKTIDGGAGTDTVATIAIDGSNTGLHRLRLLVVLMQITSLDA